MTIVNGIDDMSELLTWIAELFEEPPANIKENTSRQDIPGWDSLGVLVLMAGLDERFDISTSEGEMSGMTSVKDIINLITDKSK